ncbi:MAG: prolyl oligopeptidase family serine peptidase [Salinivirgaceae bacterium]|nr:prolyl oligopeptidase family serine peptidase [Salinivirgaceae bacterium]
MRILSSLILTLSLVSLMMAQPKKISISDFSDWNRLNNRIISSDGNYISYEKKRQYGDGVLIVYNYNTEKNDTIPYGYAAKFSPNSDFIAFKIRVAHDKTRMHKKLKTKTEKLPKEELGILNLETNTIQRFSNIKSFDLAKENSQWLAIAKEADSEKKDTANIEKDKEAVKSEKPAKKKDSKKNKDLFELVIVHPIDSVQHTFKRVVTYAISDRSEIIALVAQLNDTSKLNSVIVFNGKDQKIDTLMTDSVTIKNLTLDNYGKQLAFLISNDTAKEKRYELQLANLLDNKRKTIVDSQTTAIQEKYSPSPNGTIFFSNDASKLYFGIAPNSTQTKNDSILDEDIPTLDLWSWTDSVIQPQQLSRLERDKKQTLTSVYLIKENKCVQIADSIWSIVHFVNRHDAKFALGVDYATYLKQRVWSSLYPFDYALIDIEKGTKRKILTGKTAAYLSPMGKYTLYYDYSDSSYSVINNKSFKETNLTKSVPVMFCDEENDTPNNPRTYGVVGWTDDDAFVLIYDRFDIWKFDPMGKKSPVNITNGRANKTRFRYQQLDNNEVHIPYKKPILLSMVNEETSSEGYARVTLSDEHSLKTLLEGDFTLGAITKAENKDRVIWSSQTVKDYPEVAVSNMLFTDSKIISTANPQQSDFIWTTVEKVHWQSFNNDSLNGLLFKPQDFDSTKQYPVMVYFYERSSQGIHRYRTPSPSQSIISIPFYVSNGYLVFVPDIVYRDGFPGQSAYDAIVSGVSHLKSTLSYINKQKIGLQGQSWGGYQIAYLVTQTNIFAAAMAGAPVSNMTSAYGGIRWESGMSRIFQYEETQSRIGGTLWEKPFHYVQNSPLFMAPQIKTPLLIMANDNDGSVPWYQGIELFMALYRLQKPVWMLNYNGMSHNIESKYWANRVDLSNRMFQFFNHYLKDDPAPKWMVKGIPAQIKRSDLGY